VTAPRLLLGAVVLVLALLVQLTVVSRLPLPGAAPDLLLVVVVAFALAEGPVAGSLTGFAAGLLADVTADTQLGRTALAYVLVGYLAGLLAGDPDRSTLLPLRVVAGCSALAVVVFAAQGVLLGDPRVTAAVLGRSLVSTVPYTAVLTPLVVPLVAALVRRLDLEQVRR
jgi:rod shape-determining protein MreD